MLVLSKNFIGDSLVVKNKELLTELGDFRTGHMPDLQNFDLEKCAKKEIIFLQAFGNESFPDTYKIFFSREDSIDKLAVVNSATGTPTPWKIHKEIIFFGEEKNTLNIFNLLKRHKISSQTYSINDDLLDGILFNKNNSSVINAHSSNLNMFELSNSISVQRTKEECGEEKVGFVYCFKHTRSPDRCKIGYTNRDPRIRAAENSIQAALPEPYLPIFVCASFDAYNLEQRMHERLSNIHIAKEYFHLEPKKIISEFLSEFDDGNALGFFAYEENEKYFSDLTIKELIDHHRSQQIEESKDNFIKETDDFYLDSYRKSYSNIFFEKIKSHKYLNKFRPLDLERSSMLIRINKLENKTGLHDQKQKSLTKSGGIASALGIAILDGGASLVPAAATAAGLYFNSKKNKKNKNELESLKEKLLNIDSSISEICSEVYSELNEQCEYLDDFFDASYEKIALKLDSISRSIHLGYVVTLTPKFNFEITKSMVRLLALSVTSIAPKEKIFKGSISHIILTCSEKYPTDFSPYKFETLIFNDSIKCESITKLLLDFANEKKALIPIRGNLLSDETKY